MNINNLLKIILASLLFPVSVYSQTDTNKSEQDSRAVFEQWSHSAVSIIKAASGGVMGTGFFFGEGCWQLITAKHVLFKEGKLITSEILLRYYGSRNDSLHQSYVRLDLDQLLASGHLITHPQRDIAAIHLATRRLTDSLTADIEPGVHFTSQPVPVPRLKHNMLAVLDSLRLGGTIWLPGYPANLNLAYQAKGVTPRIDISTPLLRSGVIANINRSSRYALIDVPSFGGNSGGPVLLIDDSDAMITRLKIAGIVTEFVPNLLYWKDPVSQDTLGVALENSGIAVVEPIDFVMEMTRACESAATIRRDQ